MGLNLNNLKKSEITNFIGEVFYEELQFLVEDDNFKEFWIKALGLNSRSFSKDVLDISGYSYIAKNNLKEAVFIHLSRSSLYHNLPEFLFHPLAISDPTTSNNEVVEAVKKNREDTEKNIHFFIPFDTEFFKKHVQLTNRYLYIFTDKRSRQNLFSLASDIIAKEMSLSTIQYYKLFLNLRNSEELKENLQGLESLFSSILDCPVELQYIDKFLEDAPFETFGNGCLGLNMGLHGKVVSEIEDIYVTITTDYYPEVDKINWYKDIIHQTLEFFVLSNRDVKIHFQSKDVSEMQLGNRFLGYDTILID